MKHEDHADPDDMFADTRMTFGEHIEDLRTHLMRALKGFIFGMILAFFLAKPILAFITAPVDAELNAYYQRYFDERDRKLTESGQDGELPKVPMRRIIVLQRPLNVDDEGNKRPNEDVVFPRLMRGLMGLLRSLQVDDLVNPLKVDKEGWVKVEQVFPDPLALAKYNQELDQYYNPKTLKTLSVEEGFVIYFKVSIMAGFVISSPWVFWQVWMFIAAGLYPHEKRLVNVYLPVSLVLFIAGVLICEFFVIPKAVEALLWFNEWLGFQPDLRLNEWLGFAIFMPIVFGVAFQTPLAMLFTFMIGLFDIESFKEKRRIAWFLMAIFAAVITPSTDAVSMLFMWVPMCLLYEFGILLCWYKQKQRGPDEEFEPEESQELIEV